MLSPLNLLQEQQLGKAHAPWRILVCCQLLNRTHGRVVRPLIEEVFEHWPTPERMYDASDVALITLLRPLGFYNQRSRSLQRMSGEYAHLVALSGDHFYQQFDSGDWACRLSGCGQYAVDSLNIFVYGKTDVVTSDTWLNDYLVWKARNP